MLLTQSCNAPKNKNQRLIKKTRREACKKFFVKSISRPVNNTIPAKI
jgi:hypothetical protein